MLAGIIYALVPITLTGPLVNKFGDVPVLRGALLISGLGFAMLLLPENMKEIILAASFFVSGNSLLPAISASLISKQTMVGQGLAMGLIQSFNSLGRIIGPVFAGYLFEFDINLPFLGSAVIMFIGYLVVLFWVKTDPD
jgi:DHA1 family multidrug resistance protein-like MFS transporter